MGSRFTPARVSGIHRDEDPEARLNNDVAAHERNARVVALEGLLDGHDLLTHDGQHLCEPREFQSDQRRRERYPALGDVGGGHLVVVSSPTSLGETK